MYYINDSSESVFSCIDLVVMRSPSLCFSECQCDKCGTASCDDRTGVCHCKPGVTGLLCDRCEVWTFMTHSRKCMANKFHICFLECMYCMLKCIHVHTEHI